MDDMIRQGHLLKFNGDTLGVDGFLKAQGTSTFAIVNPECLIHRDKITNHLHVRGIQYRTASGSWKFVILIMKSLSFMFTLAICTILNGYTQVVF